MPNHVRSSATRLGAAAQSAADAISENVQGIPHQLKDLNRKVADQASAGMSALGEMADQCMTQGASG